MCGIQGFFDRSGGGREGLLEKMGSSIQHRGPDDKGFYYGPGVGLGNMRLSIIDLEGGHQPIISDDGKVVVVQNGEIYNYIELREDLKAKGRSFKTDSDTEVLLQMYLEYGVNFVNQLVGMFGIAIWDGRTDELYVFRDALGVKPMFFWNEGQEFYFGSEIKAILSAGVPRKMCTEAFHHFLSYGFVPPQIGRAHV